MLKNLQFSLFFCVWHDVKLDPHPGEGVLNEKPSLMLSGFLVLQFVRSPMFSFTIFLVLQSVRSPKCSVHSYEKTHVATFGDTKQDIFGTTSKDKSLERAHMFETKIRITRTL